MRRTATEMPSLDEAGGAGARAAHGAGRRGMKGTRRGEALAFVAAMTALLLSYIWGWQGAFRLHFLVVSALYFGLGIWSHVRWGESAHELGLRLDNWRPALRNTAAVAAPLLFTALAAGAMLGSFHFAPFTFSRALAAVAWGLFWGTSQQYGLVCFFYRRLFVVLGDEWRATIAAAGLFALFHLPNPFLTAVTLVAGTLSCWLYRKEPNLLILGIFHALIAFAVYNALPRWMTGGLRVGPGYLRLLQGH